MIAESALRHPIGDMEEHRRQLRHLLAVGTPRHVTIQVLRAGGSHPGLSGPFVLLETPDHDQLAYEEGQMMGILYAEPVKVSVLTQRHAMILRQALRPEESVQFSRALVEEL